MTISEIARTADVTRVTVRRFARGLPISRKSRAAIERALAQIAAKNP